MDRLLTDRYIRRCAQVVLILGLIALIALQVSFVVLVIGRAAGAFDPLPSYLSIMIKLLKFGFDSEFAKLSLVMAGVLPLVISAVCYSVDATTLPPKTTEVFNYTGRITVTVLGFGVLLGLITTLTSGIFPQHVELIFGDANASAPMRNTLSAILAFDALYLTHLLGVKK